MSPTMLETKKNASVHDPKRDVIKCTLFLLHFLFCTRSFISLVFLIRRHSTMHSTTLATPLPSLGLRRHGYNSRSTLLT